MQFTDNMISHHLRPLTGSAIREIFALLGKPGMISFAGGNPADSALEPDVIGNMAQRALAEYGTRLLQYGATEGFHPLRESIAGFVQSAGFETDAARILPTQGSQQALDLLIKATCDEGDTVLVESPTFLGALQAFNTYGVKLVALERDEKGVITEACEEAIKAHRPKLMYIIPTFQNPTGDTLPLERRKALADLAGRYGVIIAEDDPYRDVRFSGEALPAIKAFDTSGFVVYLGSFSKVISPGLRVGYAVVDFPGLLRKMTISKQSVDVHSPLLNQAIVDQYLRAGLMEGHLKSICASYRRQLGKMLEGFRYFPAGTRHTSPEGGLFLWVELPGTLDAAALLREAVERNVAYVPGTHFYVDGGRLNTLRLNFSNTPVDQIDAGMKALGALIQEKMKED